MISVPNSPQGTTECLLEKAILELGKVKDKGKTESRKTKSKQNMNSNTAIKWKKQLNGNNHDNGLLTKALSVNAKGAIALKECNKVGQTSDTNNAESFITEQSASPNEMLKLNLDGLSREEKKRVLRASIAQLEEEEEDQELQQLMARHDELQKRRDRSKSASEDSKRMLGNKNKIVKDNHNGQSNVDNNVVNLKSDSGQKNPSV